MTPVTSAAFSTRCQVSLRARTGTSHAFPDFRTDIDVDMLISLAKCLKDEAQSRQLL